MIFLRETTQIDHKFENDQKIFGCVGSCGYAAASVKVFFQSSVSLQDEQAQIAQIELAAKKELESKKGKKKPEKRQDRKAKDAAMQEIYSESNRQFRESGSKLNYHRPKQRTLEEFLNRKKRTVIDEIIGNDFKLLKAPSNIDEIQQKMAECEKATEEFFKNDEKDEEEESDDEDYGASKTETKIQVSQIYFQN